MMEPAVIVLLIFLVAVYILGMGLSISDDTKESSWEWISYKDSYGTRSWYRDATPKDMWRAIIWPLRMLRCIFWSMLDMINSLVQYPLLIVGIKYKESNLDREIRIFLGRRL